MDGVVNRMPSRSASTITKIPLSFMSTSSLNFD
jgi:hypothetical protein